MAQSKPQISSKDKKNFANPKNSKGIFGPIEPEAQSGGKIFVPNQKLIVSDSGKKEKFILWFDEIGIEDVPLVGGKNASLGEMIRELSSEGINVPNGFAITAYAYNYLLKNAKIEEKIKSALADLDTHNINNLMERGKKVRDIILKAEFPEELKSEIIDAYSQMHKKFGYEGNPDVAIRSSATAEDLPDASFAGQQDTYLNIRGPDAVIDACKKCFASLFTDRAISYRTDKGFNHFDVYLSIAVQKMVRSDSASSGVVFSIDTESGFKDVVFITGSYGLGENIVKGAVNPDEIYVFKPTLKKGKKPIIGKKLGTKKIKMVYSDTGTKNIDTPEEESNRFCMTDDEALKLAEWTCIIEDHYSKKAGYYKPMDIEWAKDGDGIKIGSGKLFVVQARPETVHSQKNSKIIRTYILKETGTVLITGQAVGELIGKGEANNIASSEEITKFKKGQVLVTDMTDPDWEPIMKIASAIVTNRGGRTCFSGDTKILTNNGFMTMSEIFENHEGLFVPSLNRNTLKIEWKSILAVMKRQSEVIEIETSLTGRMKGNRLKLTPDHKMLTFENRQLVTKEIDKIVEEKEYLTIMDALPALSSSSERENDLAYLLGAISTDGHIYLTKTHGEVQLIQKPTKEKEAFIKEVDGCLNKVYGKRFNPKFREFRSFDFPLENRIKVSKKQESEGSIRGKPCIGSANAYRCYGKQIAISLLEEQQNFIQTLLYADESLILNFLAGVIDGDGSINGEGTRINIYCSKEGLLQQIVVGCLRLGILLQVTRNRNIYNVQIVEKLDRILEFTKRVKCHNKKNFLSGNFCVAEPKGLRHVSEAKPQPHAQSALKADSGKNDRKRIGTRFFSARQLLDDVKHKVNYKGRTLPCIDKNLLIDSEKIKRDLLGLCPEKIKNEIMKILSSDTRMQRVRKTANLGVQDVYNITIADNHNYVVFTDRYTPIIVNNCHAAIVSRELGIPCIIGTGNGTEILKSGKKVTVSCAEGEIGSVYDGLLDFEIKEIDLKELPKTKTKIMMNVGMPDKAFVQGQIPCDGVGLAREEFIINSYIGIHPLALLNYDKLKETARSDKRIADVIKIIDEKAKGYGNKVEFFIDELARGIARIAAGFYPNDVIVRFSDFKSNEYANLVGGFLYEPMEHNPMIGWRGASRYYDKNFKPAFGLECKAILRVRNEFGLENVKVMVPFCRTIDEGKKVIETMREFGLNQGENNLQVYVMCEIPSNVILADKFSEIFDGFSIGSNDLTQLTLGLDRDSSLVAPIYDERNEAVKRLVKHVIEVVHKHKPRRKIGICGQAPSDHEDFAAFLVECGIDSISLNPDTVIKTRLKIAEKEREIGISA